MNIIETKDLTVEFSGFKAISNLNFSIKEGEIRTILGPNGAGKTTLMDLITGKTFPSKGKIFFRDKDISGLSASEISQLGIGRKFQGPNIFNDLTVKENLEIALKGERSFINSIFVKFDSEMKKRIEDIARDIGLLDRINTPSAILSHGEKQWLEMGMLLAQDPEVIILDEPTTGMTAEETFKTGEIIQTIFNGKTVIVVEHDMTFVRQIAQTVTVLHQGQFLAEGTLPEIEANEKVQHVYLRGSA